MGNEHRLAYNRSGDLTAITNPDGTVVTFKRDQYGNLARLVDSLGTVTEFTHDRNGNRLQQAITVTTPAGPRLQASTWTYDAEGRVTALTDPEGNVVRAEYDPLDRQTALIDPLGHRTDSVYDAMGHLVKRDFLTAHWSDTTTMRRVGWLHRPIG